MIRVCPFRLNRSQRMQIYFAIVSLKVELLEKGFCLCQLVSKFHLKKELVSCFFNSNIEIKCSDSSTGVNVEIKSFASLSTLTNFSTSSINLFYCLLYFISILFMRHKPFSKEDKLFSVSFSIIEVIQKYHTSMKSEPNCSRNLFIVVLSSRREAIRCNTSSTLHLKLI